MTCSSIGPEPVSEPMPTLQPAEKEFVCPTHEQPSSPIGREMSSEGFAEYLEINTSAVAQCRI